ncbi:hypothetical protein [Flavobacterium sp. FlaQc-47]|uniref:hypothetical protein n=1 Tax=Flavobacterium sp. FlaQc-47 TaxID=3374180 RepID=UPI00375834A2
MKTIKTLLATLFFAQIGYSQQLVQNINDINLLKEYEAIFINKPLKDLIKEIKPEIKVAFAYNDPSFFEFRFITRQQRLNNEGNKVSLFVNVKNSIDWNWENRPKGKETFWSKEDAEKYGNLIVSEIEIVY